MLIPLVVGWHSLCASESSWSKNGPSRASSAQVFSEAFRMCCGTKIFLKGTAEAVELLSNDKALSEVDKSFSKVGSSVSDGVYVEADGGEVLFFLRGFCRSI